VETIPDRAGPTSSGEEAGFVVRPAAPGDARSFLEMWRVVVAEKRYVRTESVTRSARYYRRRYFRRSWADEQASLVAVHGDRVIGHLNVAREEGPMTRHVASLGMAVAPEWRGRGVGTALMAEAIRWAKEMGVEKLALSVYPHNEPALALYRKFGFEVEGRLTGHSKKSIGYLDEIVMGLWLIDRSGRDSST
jgi:L-phenylalanine/L-methionine N-acetyltransferase